MDQLDLLDILKDKNVLYAEDEAGIRDSVGNILKMFFSKVVTVSNGEKALEEIETNRFDLLMFDICMPGIDGLEIIKKIRENDKNIPIIVLTAHTEQEYLWRAIDLRILRYLKKPYNRHILIEALESVAKEYITDEPKVRLGDDIVYNKINKSICSDKVSLYLSKNESRFLEYMLKYKNQVLTYDAIFNYVWGYESPGKDALKFLVKELRKKIGKNLIKNIYGIGYMLDVK